MKSALFVDFDNVYSGLRRLDQDSADQFARNPGVWMAWLINSLEMPDTARPGAKRRVLVRRCYLNPQAYQRFRPSFNLAGFEIVDCPSLTSEGKTSTDIHMVLDIVDLLQHEVHYDEFIVFSADADFTPVLRKLRRWDRRTTVLAIGFPSAAYRASADLLIDQDEFVRNAIGLNIAEVAECQDTSLPSGTRLAEGVSALIHKAVIDSPSPVPLARIASQVLAQTQNLDASTWGGVGSFRALVESLNLSPLIVSWEAGGTIHDPRRHANPSVSVIARAVDKADTEMRAIADLVKSEVGKSHQPVACAKLAAVIHAQYGSFAADWNGKGTFRKFVESLELKPIEFEWNVNGGIAFDPERHSVDGTPTEVACKADWSNQELFAVASQIHDLTGVPLLTPDKYRNLLDMIAADVAERPFHLMETGKRVRDRCKDSGLPVSRQDVNHVLRGLLMRGHAFEAGQNDAETLGALLIDNIRSLCLREQMVINGVTDAAIQGWITGKSQGR